MDEQVVEPEAQEWAAERGLRTNALFEVLWKAGNKSWMTYKQVRDLNLLVPYLELLGHEKIEELIEIGTRQPPQEDPQIFLGCLGAQVYKEDWDTDYDPTDLLGTCKSAHLLPSPSPTFTSNRNKYSFSPFTLMGNPNSARHPGKGTGDQHPFISIDSSTGIVTIHDPENPGQNFSAHPLHIQLLLAFNLEVRQMRGRPTSPMPLGYQTFAEILNLADPVEECQYRLTVYSEEQKGWEKVNKLFPPRFLPSTFTDPCLELLVTLGFITNQGNVDKQTVEDAVQAWRAPSGQRVQRIKQFHARQTATRSPYAQTRPQASPIADRSHGIHEHHSAVAGPSTPRRDKRPGLYLTKRTPVSTEGPARPSNGKGKEKAVKETRKEDSAMEVDPPAEVVPPDDLDADSELEDFPESPKEPEKQNE